MSGNSGSMSDLELRLCKEALSNLMSTENAKKNFLFLEPVDTKLFTTYLDVVRRPMDLGTVKSNLKAGRYATRDAFFSDAMLCFENALKFHKDNPESAWIIKLAGDMKKMASKEKKRADKKYREAMAGRKSPLLPPPSSSTSPTSKGSSMPADFSMGIPKKEKKSKRKEKDFVSHADTGPHTSKPKEKTDKKPSLTLKLQKKTKIKLSGLSASSSASTSVSHQQSKPHKKSRPLLAGSDPDHREILEGHVQKKSATSTPPSTTSAPLSSADTTKPKKKKKKRKEVSAEKHKSSGSTSSSLPQQSTPHQQMPSSSSSPSRPPTQQHQVPSKSAVHIRFKPPSASKKDKTKAPAFVPSSASTSVSPLRTSSPSNSSTSSSSNVAKATAISITDTIPSKVPKPSKSSKKEKEKKIAVKAKPSAPKKFKLTLKLNKAKVLAAAASSTKPQSPREKTPSQTDNIKQRHQKQDKEQHNISTKEKARQAKDNGYGDSSLSSKNGGESNRDSKQSSASPRPHSKKEIRMQETKDIHRKELKEPQRKEGKEHQKKEGKELRKKEGKELRKKEGKEFSKKEGKEFSKKEGKEFSKKEGKEFSKKDGKEIHQRKDTHQRKEGKELRKKEGKELRKKEGKELRKKEVKEGHNRKEPKKDSRKDEPKLTLKLSSSGSVSNIPPSRGKELPSGVVGKPVPKKKPVLAASEDISTKEKKSSKPFSSSSDGEKDREKKEKKSTHKQTAVPLGITAPSRGKELPKGVAQRSSSPTKGPDKKSNSDKNFNNNAVILDKKLASDKKLGSEKKVPSSTDRKSSSVDNKRSSLSPPRTDAPQPKSIPKISLKIGPPSRGKELPVGVATSGNSSSLSESSRNKKDVPSSPGTTGGPISSGGNKNDGRKSPPSKTLTMSLGKHGRKPASKGINSAKNVPKENGTPKGSGSMPRGGNNTSSTPKEPVAQAGVDQQAKKKSSQQDNKRMEIEKKQDQLKKIGIPKKVDASSNQHSTKSISTKKHPSPKFNPTSSSSSSTTTTTTPSAPSVTPSIPHSPKPPASAIPRPPPSSFPSATIAPMTPLRKGRCLKFLSALKRRNTQNVHWFLKPVSDARLIEDYRSKIPVPMDLGTISTKIDKGEYPTIAEFVMDVRRVFANCLRYNTSINDTFRPVARDMLSSTEDLLAFFIAKPEAPSVVYPKLLYCWKLCLTILDKLLTLTNKDDGHQTAHYFLHPVSFYCGGNFPDDYLDRVKTPVDLGTVTSRLFEGTYQSVGAFVADCRLICDNCITFYGNREDGASFTDQANRLRELMVQQMGALMRYDQSPSGAQGRSAAINAPPIQIPAPKKSLLQLIIKDLKNTNYTDRCTKLTESAILPFEKPVNLTLFPDYEQYVETPMDLETVDKKIEAGEYETLEDFEYDALLIFRNCEKYNIPKRNEHIVALAKHCAKSFRKFLNNRLKQMEAGTSGDNTSKSKTGGGDKNAKKRSQSPVNPPNSKKPKIEGSTNAKSGKLNPRTSITVSNVASAKAESVSSTDKLTSDTTPKPKSAKPPGNAGKKRLPSNVPKDPDTPLPLGVVIEQVKAGFPNRRSFKALESWEGAAFRFFRELSRHPWISNTRAKFIFHVPVALMYPELKSAYAEKIQKPMDLTTAECKFLQGGVYTNPQEFVDDVALIFANAVTFNKAGYDMGEPMSCAYFDAARHLLRFTRWISLEHLTSYLEEDMEPDTPPADSPLPNGPLTRWRLTKGNKKQALDELNEIVMKYPIEKSEEGEKFTWMEIECEKLLKSLRHQSDVRYMSFFIQPNYPADYAAYIAKPMDWETCQRTLQKRKYIVFGDLIEDLRLIFSNALKYNARAKGTDTVSGRAFDAAKHMSSKLEQAIEKMLMSVSERLEREKIDKITAEREEDAEERAEEERRRTAWQKERERVRATEVKTRVETIETVKVIKRTHAPRERMDFDFPFFDEEEGHHEQSHMEVLRQQKLVFEKQQRDRADMQRVTLALGSAIFLRMTERLESFSWAKKEAEKKRLAREAIAKRKRMANEISSPENLEETDGIVKATNVPVEEMNREDRRPLKMTLVATKTRKKKKPRRNVLE